MKLENIVSVSGLGGLFKLLGTRSNGLLIESFETGKRQFVSIRKHQFTPLVSIGIYTYTDVVNLDEVLKKVQDNADTIPSLDEKSDDLRTWFRTIVPDHDEDRVHISDIRKVIKWYTFLTEFAPAALADGGDEEE
ncbi:MAG: DUF5606 domain-containing protein [Bacteroidota bacterium]|nr:DUF5606 domain-containing protein [Bacteroidota bacterium]